jgi:hypothetical protein
VKSQRLIVRAFEGNWSVQECKHELTRPENQTKRLVTAKDDGKYCRIVNGIEMPLRFFILLAK